MITRDIQEVRRKNIAVHRLRKESPEIHFAGRGSAGLRPCHSVPRASLALAIRADVAARLRMTLGLLEAGVSEDALKTGAARRL